MLSRKSIFPLAIVLCLIVSQSGCLYARLLNDKPPAPLIGPRDQKKVIVPEFDPLNPRHVFEKEVLEKLSTGDLDGIDKMADIARAKKERLSGGYWKIDAIYEGLTGFFSEYKGQSIKDEMWSDRIELLRSWKESRPRSITARVALAEAYIEFGWFARGGGYIGSVSDKDYKTFRERLDIAEDELREAYELSMQCPRLYREILYMGMAKGWPVDEFEKIYREAIEYEPNYLQVHLVKSENVSPKWGGKQGDWQEFIDALPGKLSSLHSDEVDLIYFVVVANKLGDTTAGINWAMISKERIEKGFADLERKYGVDRYRLNQYAYISCLTMNTVSAREAFERIGDDRDGQVWGEQTFKMMRQYAQNGFPK